MTLPGITGLLRDAGSGAANYRLAKSYLTDSAASPSACEKRKLEDIAFGKADWNRYFGAVGYDEEEIKKAIDNTLEGRRPDFPKEISDIIYHYLQDGISPPPPNIDEILETPCPFHPDKQVRETHALVLIPKTVHGKPFTLNVLQKLTRNPREKPAVDFKYHNESVKKELETIETETSYWILMTKDIIPNSRNETHEKQQQLALKNKGYNVPTVLEAAVVILMHYFKTDETLFGTDPRTYTRCQETIAKYQWPVVIGEFSSHDITVDCSPLAWDAYGMAAVRRLGK